MIGWYGTAMLCYVTPKEHLGLAEQEGRQGRRDRLQDRRARGRPRQGPSRARSTGTTRSRRRASSSAGKISSTSALDPIDGARLPRRDAAGARREGRALLLDVRTAFLLDEDHAGRARVRRARHGREVRRVPSSSAARSTCRRTAFAGAVRRRNAERAVSRRGLILVAGAALAACSGNFGSGTTPPGGLLAVRDVWPASTRRATPTPELRQRHRHLRRHRRRSSRCRTPPATAARSRFPCPRRSRRASHRSRSA